MKRTYSIRGVLLVLLVAEMAAAILLTWYLWYDNGRTAVDELMQDRCAEISRRVDQHVQGLLGKAHLAISVQQDAFEEGLLSQENLEMVQKFQLRQLYRYDYLASIGVGFPDGSFVGVQRDEEEFLLLSCDKEAGTLIETPVGGGETRVTGGFDPRKRPWYEKAIASEGKAWSEVYTFFGEPIRLGLTAVEPYRNATGEVIRVMMSDLILGPVDEFLRQMDLPSGGRICILERSGDGLLVATSGSDSPIETSGGSVERLRAPEVKDPLIRSAVIELTRTHGIPSKWPTEGAIKVEEEDLFVYLKEIRKPGSLDWLTVVVIPRANLMAGVEEGTRWTALIFLGLILLTAPLMIRTARGITRPIEEISDQLEQVARFDLEVEDPKPSRLSELRRMQKTMSSMKSALNSFEKYVPSRVVRQLVREKRVAEPGMEPATGCVFFSDVKNFTTIAETLEPNRLMEVGGEYLEEMTRIVQERNGILDKYIGDALMAFWIAELDGKRVTSAACDAALASQAKLVELRALWKKRDLPQLESRIGLHTGPVLVGNIGSSRRLNYTVLGDTVNLASRLEGLNRVYGTHVIVSEQIMNIVQGEFHCRPIDQVSVKGKRRGGKIYELVGHVDDITEEDRKLCLLQGKALELFYSGKFLEARRAFDSLLSIHPEDLSLQVLLNRSVLFESDPPPDWHGVTPMDRNIVNNG